MADLRGGQGFRALGFKVWGAFHPHPRALPLGCGFRGLGNFSRGPGNITGISGLHEQGSMAHNLSFYVCLTIGLHYLGSIKANWSIV